MMRRLLGIFALCCLAASLGAAAKHKPARHASANDAPEDPFAGHNRYFKGGSLGKGGVVSAEATERFDALADGAKSGEIKAMLEDVKDQAEELDGPLLFKLRQGGGSAGSLWSLDSAGRSLTKLESWDTTEPLLAPDSKAGRWFYYIGIGALIDPSHLAFSFSEGLKVGTYLYKNVFDMAVGIDNNSSFTYNQFSYDWDSSSIYTLGLLGRGHLPLGPWFSAMAGAQVGYNASTAKGSTATTDTALLTGLSWIFGAGSLDFSARIGTGTPSYSLGVTTFIENRQASPAPAP